MSLSKVTVKFHEHLVQLWVLLSCSIIKTRWEFLDRIGQNCDKGGA